MDIFPTVTARKFNECQSGELVLMPLGPHGGLSYALLASQAGSRGEKRFVVALTGDDYLARMPGGGTLPRYFQPDSNRFGTVLSFGRDYIVEVDHRGPVEFGTGDRLRHQNGALALHGSAWFLRIYPFSGGSLDSAFLGLPDGAIPDEEPVEGVSFGRWAIYAKGAGPRDLGERAKPLVAFSASVE